VTVLQDLRRPVNSSVKVKITLHTVQLVLVTIQQDSSSARVKSPLHMVQQEPVAIFETINAQFSSR